MYSSEVAESSSSRPVVGVIGPLEIVSMGLNPDNDNRFEIEVKQPNGSIVKHTEFEASEGGFTSVEEQAKATSSRVKHFVTKIIPEAEFQIKGVDSFQSYCREVVRIVGDRYVGQKFEGIFIYNKKGYVCFPRFAPFFRNTSDDTVLTISAYDQKNNMSLPEADSEVVDTTAPEFLAAPSNGMVAPEAPALGGPADEADPFIS